MEITINGKKVVLQNIMTKEEVEAALDKLKLGEFLDVSGLFERFKIAQFKSLKWGRDWDQIYSYTVNGRRMFGSRKSIAELLKDYR